MYELSRDTVREDDPLFTNLKERTRVKSDFDKKSTTVSVKFDDKVDACRYPLVELNHSNRVYWLVNRVKYSKYKSLMLRLHYYNGPLPYCATRISKRYVYLYWKLRIPLVNSRTYQREAELIYKRTYAIFCHNLSAEPIRHIYVIPNPTYCEFETTFLDRREVDFKDFINFNVLYRKKNGTKNLDIKYYFNASDYVFHQARNIAWKLYKKKKPISAEYDSYIEILSELIGKIDLTEFDDAHTVDFDNMASYVGEYYFKHYSKFSHELSVVNSKRGKRKGAKVRAKSLMKVIDLARANVNHSEISRITGIPRPTVIRWLQNHLCDARIHEARRNAL